MRVASMVLGRRPPRESLHNSQKASASVCPAAMPSSNGAPSITRTAKLSALTTGTVGAEVETVEAVAAGVGISFAVHATSEPGSSAAYCPEKVQRGSAAA